MVKFFAKAYVWMLIIILYLPILVIAVFSFTESKVLGNWTGFSTELYTSVFSGGVNKALTTALINTFFIAVVAAGVSTILGSYTAVGLYTLKGNKRKLLDFFNNIPVLNPDIITGISLFLLFVFLGVTQGYLTVILSHVAFCTPYVILSVMPRLQSMNPNIYEAALDLGATPMQAVNKVIVPEIRQSMVSGFILAFTLSIDDFAVTLFTSGNNGLQTLSTYIYNDARRGGLTPELRPLSTIIFVVVLLLLLIVNYRASKARKKREGALNTNFNSH